MDLFVEQFSISEVMNIQFFKSLIKWSGGYLTTPLNITKLLNKPK